MPEIKCACENPKCIVTLQFADGNLIVTDKKGQEQLIYLDPNAIADLVCEARKALIEKIFGKQE